MRCVCVCRDRIDTYECAVWRDPPVQGSIRTSNCNARAQAPRGYSTVFLLCFWRRAQEPEFQTGKQFFYLSLYIIVSTFFFLCFVLKRHKKKKNGATRRAKRSRNACQRWLPPLSVGFLAKQKIMLVIAVDQTLTNPQGLPFIFLPFPSSFFFFLKGIYKPEVQVFFFFFFFA